MDQMLNPVTPVPPNNPTRRPPTRAPAIPIRMVTMNPPGSSPGRISLPKAPAMSPTMIQEMMPILSLEDTPAREVMVPRPDVASLPAGMPLRELFRFVATGEHTRYPVHEEGSPDRIVGAVHAKDVMRAVEDGGGLGAQLKTEDVMGEVLTVPENRRVDAVLQDLKDRRLRMAIVIDEWGSFEGIVTMEDIVEEIVGEIRDEFDEDGSAVRELP